MNSLFEDYKKIAYEIAYSYCRRHNCYIYLQDIIQAALYGLWQASNNYDKNKSSFTTFASHRIKGEIKDFMRNCISIIRLPVSQFKLGKKPITVFSIDKYEEYESINNYEDNVIEKLTNNEIKNTIFSLLETKEIILIKLLYYNRYKQYEIARLLNLSTMAISARINKIYRKLRNNLIVQKVYNEI
jgi:RNA polymerase sigma factor (sigma-70 family)